MNIQILVGPNKVALATLLNSFEKSSEISALQNLRALLDKEDKKILNKIEELKNLKEKETAAAIKSGARAFTLEEILNEKIQHGETMVEYKEKERIIKATFGDTVRSSGCYSTVDLRRNYRFSFRRNVSKSAQFEEVKRAFEYLTPRTIEAYDDFKQKSFTGKLLDVSDYTLSENGCYSVISNEKETHLICTRYGRARIEHTAKTLDEILEIVWEEHPYHWENGSTERE